VEEKVVEKTMSRRLNQAHPAHLKELTMRRHLPSASMVVALIALGAGLGGSAVAAGGLITGAEIKDHSIGLNDLSYRAIARLRGQQGPRGPRGLQGRTGSRGPAGTIGGKLTFQTATTSLAAGTVGSATATCPTGTAVLSGGAHTTGLALWATEPLVSGGNTGWFAGATAPSVIQAEVDAYAICLAP
jgi:hypothetical protein